MNFILVRSKSGCTGDCPTWISAEGKIGAETPERLKRLLSQIGKDKPTVVFRSPGGNVQAAMRMGRMIRKAGLTTSVGTTVLDGCPITDFRCKASIVKTGASYGTAYPAAGYCYSACPLALAGGVARSANLSASIGVHQITTFFSRAMIRYRVEYKQVNGKKVELSRKEIGRKDVSAGSTTKLDAGTRDKLVVYFKEMGVNPLLISLMMTASPKELRTIQPNDAKEYGLLTSILAPQQSPALRPCAEGALPGLTCYRQAAEAHSEVSAAANKAQLDPSCDAVVKALTHSWESARFAFTTFNVKPYGLMEMHSEFRFIDGTMFRRTSHMRQWSVAPRQPLPMMGQGGPIWTECQSIGTRGGGETVLQGYSSVWKQPPYEAKAEIWLSKRDNKIWSLKREFPDSGSIYPFATALDVFDYKSSQIVEPPVTPDLY